MKRTRVCDLLRIDYPILQGGMLWLATAELAGAVSNAGALGVISPNAGMERHGDPLDNLRAQIAEARKLTKKPFGINIPLDLERSGLLINLILIEKVKIVVTAAGNPDHYTDVLRKAGVKVLHVVSTVKQAQSAESCGADAVIVEGVEAAGHLGFDEIPLFSLIPQVVDVVSIPVIAAGGIADARGVVAAFALGAEGVQLGTRFVAVKESIAHSQYKEAILKAGDTDTIITCRRLLPTRSLRTEFTRRLLELEESGASASDIRNFLEYSRARTGQIEGDLENGEAYSGASAGMVKEVLPVAEVVKRLVEGYQKVIKKIT
ncbi:MAG TPA: nitronate monooxygenase [Thermodesulfobacteriota bacterium]|nr:nitronate monooxygenase [Thermodesulfobacteriota bacterium]